MQEFLFILLLLSISRGQYTNWTKLGVDEEYGSYLDSTSDLYKELFQTRPYQRDLSPVYSKQPKNSSAFNRPPLNVSITLSFVKIFELDPQKQTMTALIEFVQQWKDVRLAWDREDFDDVEMIWVKYDTIWIPEYSMIDLSSYNEAWPDYRRPARLTSDGAVYLDSMAVATLSCLMDLGTFPFDTQTCPIAFALNTYSVNQITMEGVLFPDFDYSKLSGNGEWELRNITKEMIRVPSDIAALDLLFFNLHLKREPNFYLYVIVLPCFLLTLLSVIGMFWTENNKDEQLTKLSIGLTSMMSMTIFVQMVSEQIPRTSTFPLLGE
ncbi:unnamed protein product, partial [Mesorhabditis belari]|uniref:Neurotransmitter-gated ion-channel ligand-binding domain-containing protein n=1 Tax=Mesorhabditis belari TaxID=2138241 RepID=A0AAF3FQV5_9BILA